MDLQLNDAIVLIAGSSRGIGLATAKAFLEEGAKVMITGRDIDDVRTAKEDLVAQFGPEHVFSFSGDLCEKKDIDACLAALRAHWGEPTCVVANIGRGRLPKDWQFSTEQWEEAFRLNFHGSVLLAEAVLAAMFVAKRGSIVFTASIAGVENIGAPAPYAAAKAALIAYSKTLATQAAAHQVRVNCIAPGNILFPGGSWEQRLREDTTGTKAHIQANVPLQRFGTPEEIANAIVFLSSSKSAFTTGACVVVDGGQTHSL
jgi:3-oxoacyl-[acyl-carrier protein] reductase